MVGQLHKRQSTIKLPLSNISWAWCRRLGIWQTCVAKSSANYCQPFTTYPDSHILDIIFYYILKKIHLQLRGLIGRHGDFNQSDPKM